MTQTMLHTVYIATPIGIHFAIAALHGVNGADSKDYYHECEPEKNLLISCTPQRF